ncbi:MAG: TonB-dependent receptor [Candidatus Aminicenantes bacterium]|nr:TonB-dependent receptor [Candidatus Aminicenantes bacterium]
MRILKLLFPLSLLLMVAFGGLIFGQTQTGTITGRVADETDAVLPGVTVTLSSEALITATKVTTTNEYGVYKFIALPPGTYDVKFELEGFQPNEQRGIKISAYFVARVNVVLTMAALEEVITVTGESPAVDVSSNVISTSVDRDLLDHIPSGRDIWVIAEQVPGVVQDRYNIGGTESAQQSAGFLHGSQAQQEFSFDGLSNNWPGGHGGYVMVYFDYDSFEEVQALTSAAPAEIGTGGLYMNMITKSGGNDFHGTTTFLYEPGSWQGNNVTPEMEDMGITTANPVEHILNFSPTLGGPIIKNKMWFFGSYLRYDINTQILGMLRPDGTPEVDVNHQTNAMAKVTTQINPTNKLMAMYYFNYQNRFYRREGYAFIEEKASWRQIEPAHIVQGQWTSILPKDILLDVRLGYVTHVFPLERQPEVQPTDISRVDDIRSTLMGSADYYHWHTAPRTQFNTSLSYFSDYFLGGSHDIKFGTEYSRQHTYYDMNVNGDMVMHFYDGVPGYVLTLAPVEEQISKFNTFSAYLQDSFSIGNRLTINAGVRFEYFQGYNPAQGSPAGVFWPARSYPAEKNIPNWKNVVPRFGISYDIFGDGKTALKASFSRYTQMEGARLPQTLNPNSMFWEVRPWNDSNGNLFAELDELLPPVAVGGGVNVSLDPNTTRPLSDEVTVGIEHQVGEDLALAATYYYRKNFNWMGMVNQAVPIDSFTPVSVSAEGKTITVYNQDPATLGLVDRVITNIPEFYENYHGFEVTARKKFSNRWQMLVGYTRGRTLGYYAEARWGFQDTNDPNNLVNIKDAYHPQDRTNIFKLQGTYFFPMDITLSANYRYYTGEPVTRWLAVSGLNQGPVNVALEPRGTFRYDNVSILDLRVSKIFTFDKFSLEAMLNVFNAFNSDAVVGMVTSVGPWYGRPYKLLSPVIAGFGVRLSF